MFVAILGEAVVHHIFRESHIVKAFQRILTNEQHVTDGSMYSTL